METRAGKKRTLRTAAPRIFVRNGSWVNGRIRERTGSVNGRARSVTQDFVPESNVHPAAEFETDFGKVRFFD